MGTLKFAILGLLNQKSMTGYELTKEFETTLFEFWHAKHSQIYPELKRLYQDKLVDFEIEISGTSLEKKLYTITDEGRKEFLDWLGQQHKMPPTQKDEFRLQLFFTHFVSPERRLKLLKDYLDQHKKRLEHLKENQKKFTSLPPSDTDAFSDYLVLLGAVMREENTCQWLEKCIELCENTEPLNNK